MVISTLGVVVIYLGLLSGQSLHGRNRILWMAGLCTIPIWEEGGAAYVCSEVYFDFASLGLCESTWDSTNVEKLTRKQILGAKGPEHFVGLSQPSGHGWEALQVHSRKAIGMRSQAPSVVRGERIPLSKMGQVDLCLWE